MHDEKVKLDNLYKLIDLCKYASVDGEKIEIVLNSTVDGNREISIGLKGGLSRDRYTFAFANGNDFDDNVLPLIVQYFLNSDEVSSWDYQKSQIAIGTNKSLIRTNSENEFLIQTYSDTLIDELKEKITRTKNDVVVDKNNALTVGEEKCEKALAYVNESMKNNAVLEGLSSEEKVVALELLRKAYSIKHSYTDEELLEFMRMQQDVEHAVIDKVTANIAKGDTTLISKVESFLKAEKRFSKYKDDESFIIREKVAMYLAKIGYFDTRLNFPKNTNLEQLNDLDIHVSKDSNNKYSVLLNAKVYFVENNMIEEVRVVDEFVDFLVKKQIRTLEATKRKKERNNESKKEENEVKRTEEVVLTPSLKILNKENVITDFSILADTFALCNGSKINNEKVLVSVLNHESNPAKRKVEISLIDGLSSDRYEYVFEDGTLFDKEILPKIVSMMNLENKDFNIEFNESKLFDRDNMLLTYEDGNQCLISVNGIRKTFIDNNVVKSQSVSEDKLVDVARINRESTNEGVANLVNALNNISAVKSNSLDSTLSQTVSTSQQNGQKNDVDLKLVNDSNNTTKVNSNSLDSTVESDVKLLSDEELYTILEHELLTYGLEKDEKETKNLEFSDKFEKLHYLARKYYPCLSINGDLLIYERNTNKRYVPETVCEREEIEFASFWAKAAGVANSRGDIFPGENVAFGDEARKLFNIMDVHFEESLKRGINIDIDALNRQFINSGYNKSSMIFERLFKHTDELLSYYDIQLNKKSEDSLIVESQISLDNNDVVTKKDIDNDESLNAGTSVTFDQTRSFVSEETDHHTLTDLDEIKIAFDVASTYSSSDKPVSLKIFFPNEEINKSQITVSYGPTNDEDVLYQKIFDTNTVMEEFLPEICDMFVLQNGVITNDTFKVPNTNKGGSITLGMNDSLLQMSNANMEDVLKLQEYLSNAMTVSNKGMKRI